MTTNVDVVAAAYAAINTGDVRRVLAAMDDDVDFEVAEHSPHWTGSPLHGPERVLAHVLGRLRQDFAHHRMVVDRIIESGDVVVAQVHYCGVANGSGRELRAQAAHVFDLRDGKVVRFQEYVDTWLTADLTGLVGTPCPDDRLDAEGWVSWVEGLLAEQG